MSSPRNFSIDDKDLDDAELWAVIDSAAAASHSSTKPTRKPLTLLQSSSPLSPLSPPPSKSLHSSFNLVHSPHNHHYSHKPKSRSISTIEDTNNNGGSGEVLQESSSTWSNKRSPKRIKMDCGSGYGDENNNRMIVVNQNLLRTPKMTSPVSLYSSPECCGGFNGGQEISPVSENSNSPGVFQRESFGEEMMVHSLSGRFPSVSLFKEYQNKAMAILEKSDWTMISGSPYIKKSGWRKIAFYFNVSFEIKDKSIELDENRNVQRAEFTVRAHMQGGRFSDGWGSCERREKRFMKPNQDIPSTAETRAKNKACQDLLGIGQYRSGT